METKIRIVKNTPKGLTMVLDNVTLTWLAIAAPSTKIPRANAPHGSYEATAIIPGAAMPAIKQTLEAALKQWSAGYSEWDDKSKKLVISTALSGSDGTKGLIFRDGDKRLNKSTGKPYAGFEGNFYISTRTNAKKADNGLIVPQFGMVIKDAQSKDIPAHEISDKVYNGVIGSLLITLAPTSFGMEKYISKYLAGVQVRYDGERQGAAGNFFEPAEPVEMGAGSETFDLK